ncbi:MAG: hypothetical protein JRN08_03495 [Nitrososphaerota archaeon]|nr:hypothetical protein [Nitrososphaerota archaeon]
MFRKAVAATVISAALVLVFFEAPVVGYSQQLTIPNDYQPIGVTTCSNEYFPTSTTTTALTTTAPNLTQLFDEYESCLSSYLYPPYVVSAQVPLAYALFGIGPPPFPDHVVFSQGNYTALVFFNGTKPSAAYEFYIPAKSLAVQPSGVVQILNASIQRDGYGNLVLTAAIKNIGSSPLNPIGADAYGVAPLESPGYGETYKGLTWYPEGFPDNCAALLPPGRVCTVTSQVANTTFPSSKLSFRVGVAGVADGNAFFYSQDFVEPSPRPGVDQGWVDLFMGEVDQSRQGVRLAENTTLDSFAALRFKTASKVPGTSDFGFQSDEASFFGGAGSPVNELLLFPGNAPPYLFATELQGSGPSHWSALLDAKSSQFGYFVGKAPYFDVSADCPVTEVTSSGVNITQYFESHGCTVTPVADVPWLVIILGE